MVSKREYKYFMKGYRLAAKRGNFPFDWNDKSQKLTYAKSTFKRVLVESILPALHVINVIYFTYLISEYKQLKQKALFEFTVNAYICLGEGFFCIALLASRGHRIRTFMDLYNQVDLYMKKRKLIAFL